jgi:hypothetical protein
MRCTCGSGCGAGRGALGEEQSAAWPLTGGKSNRSPGRVKAGRGGPVEQEEPPATKRVEAGDGEGGTTGDCALGGLPRRPPNWSGSSRPPANFHRRRRSRPLTGTSVGSGTDVVDCCQVFLFF